MKTLFHRTYVGGTSPGRRLAMLKNAHVLPLLILFFAVLTTTSTAQTFTFTNAGAAGQFGPSQTQINTAYASTNLSGNVAAVDGIQYWIVPRTALYKVEASGAQGYGTFGGRGAYIKGEFFFTAGDTIKILVGQKAPPPVGSVNQYAGGGGSFVTFMNNTALIVAGGGGGSWATSYTSVTDASIGTSGNTAVNAVSNGAGGTNGSGGATAGSADGGGGFISNGGGTGGGFSFLNGGAGGAGTSTGHGEGGFGGGGGTSSWDNYRCGGGGGYSGGGAAGQTSSAGNPEAGGGGCYNAGSYQNNIAGIKTGDGLVVISAISSGAQNDAGVFSIDAPTIFCSGNNNVSVTIRNFGTTPISSATINWSVNGVAQSSYSYSGALDTIGGSSPSTASVTIGSYNFTSAAHTIKAWTSLPNNASDPTATNDSASAIKQASLPPPTGLKSSKIDSTTATLRWTGGNSSNTFAYVNSTSSAKPTGPGTIIATDSVMLSGLIRATTYYTYVREICASGDSSTWIGPFTYKTNCSGPLNGSYSVNPTQAASNTNFVTLTDALQSLYSCTIAGPVTLNVAANSGPFTGGVDLTAITGASATNKVVINGGGNTIYESAAAYFLHLDGVKHLTINNFKFINTVETTAKIGIVIRGASEYVSITNNTINMGMQSTSTLSAGIVMSALTTSSTSAGDNGHYITITNNEIIGGYYGITAIGQASYTNCYGHLIKNNIIRDYYSYGVYLVNADSVVVESNEFNRLTRTTVTTFYGTYLSTCRNIKIRKNDIHGAGTGSYTAYPFYITTSVNTAGYETEIINNKVYDIPTTGTVYGVYGLGTRDYIKINHNTFHLATSGTSVVRAVFLSTAPTNHQMKNNIFSIGGTSTGIKYGIYVTTVAATFSSNNNVFHNNSTAGTNYVGYWTASRTTLGDWQTASSQDANSFTVNPQFAQASVGNLIPLTTQVDNIGTSVGVSTDFSGNSRSGSTPDAGCYEFTGIAGDLSIVSATLLRTNACYNSSDTAEFIVNNPFGSTVNFATDSLSIVWKVTGPVNSNGTTVINSGTLAVGANRSIKTYAVNMSLPGTYQLTAYIKPNALNISAFNDTLGSPSTSLVKSLLSVQPKLTTFTSYSDSVKLNSTSAAFPPGLFYMSEICHFKTTNGAPTGGWPSYLLADDYIEITGVPYSDLGGITLEQWTTTLQSTYTFPSGTVLSPNGTAIIAVGELGSSTPSPSNYYYHGTGTYTGTFGSTTTAGRILKNSNGVIIDAVVYGTYTFPVAANVSVTDWKGNTPALSSSGNKLIGAYTKDTVNWVNSGTAGGNPLQNPNAVNTGVTVPQPIGLTGFRWKLGATIIDTTSSKYVGRYANHGTYSYVASYTNQCGTFYDTAVVKVPAILDLAADLALPGTITCGNDLPIEVTLSNKATEAIDFTTDNATVTVKVTGKTTQTFSVVVNSNALNGNQSLAKGANLTVPLGNLNIDATGTYYFVASVTLAGDLNTNNNTDAMDSITLNSIADAGPNYQVCSGSPTSIGGTPTAIGGTGPYTYVWGPTAGLVDPTLDNPTAAVTTNTYYNVKVTDNLGCYSMDTMLIEALSQASPVVSGSASVCPGTYTYSTPAGAGTSYLWTVTGGTILGSDSSQTVSVSWTNPGTGTVKVKQTILAGGCFAVTAPYSVTINPKPSITFTSTGSTTFCAGSNVNLLAIPQTGNSYAWKLNGATISGANTNVYTASTSGNYKVIITNSYTCVDSSSAITVTSNPLPTATITPASSTTFCSGDSVVLNANTGTGLSYQWLMNNAAISGATNSSYGAIVQGSFTVQVTNANGCSLTSSQRAITVNPLPTASVVAMGATTLCQGQDVMISAIPVTGASYQWNMDGTAISGATSVNFVANSSGAYTLKVTSATGCMNVSNSVAVVVNSLPTANITPAGTTTFCQGGSVDLDASTGTGLSYQWNLGGTAISGATSASYTASIHGAYSVTITNSSNCASTSSPQAVVVNALPSASIIPIGALSFCQGDQVTLAAIPVAGASYQWRVYSSQISGATASTLTANSTGNYSVEVTTSAGCSMVSNTIAVVVKALPTASITASGTTNFCDGASVDLVSAAAAGTTQQWYSNNLPIAGAISGTYTANQSGVYTVKVTSAQGCELLSSGETVTVNPNPISVIIFNGPNAICQGETSLLVGLSQSGQSYQWLRDGSIILGAIQSTYDADQSGDYSIQVSNASGCIAVSATKTITVNPMPVASITPAGPTTVCSGTDVILNATTGAGYSYQWFNNGFMIMNANSASYSAQVSGTYTVKVTTTSGCFELSSGQVVVINQTPTAAISANGTLSICENSAVILGAATVSNGSYQWKLDGAAISGANSVDYSAMLDGAYTVVVNDVLTGCTSESNALTVEVSPIPLVQFAANDVCLGSELSFSNQSTISNGNLSYAWKFGDNASSTDENPTHTYASAGSFDVVLTAVSDQGIGCSASYQMAITVKPAPVSTFTWGHIGNSIVSFKANDATGTSYSWNFGDGNSSTTMEIEHLYAAGGNYVVTLNVINAQGCETQTSTTITFDPTGLRKTEANATKIAVYPNPFVSETSISYDLISAANVKIEVYDLMGRKLKTMSNEKQIAGTHTQVINASDIAPQTLVIRLTIDNKVYNQKVSLVH